MEKEAVIQLDAVASVLLADEVGYIRIRTFNQLTSEQFAERLCRAAGRRA